MKGHNCAEHARLTPWVIAQLAEYIDLGWVGQRYIFRVLQN